MNIETIADIDQLPATITYMGESIPEGWGVVCDSWRVTIKGKGFDYHTGLGHRKAIKKWARNPYVKNTVAYEEWERGYTKPVKPKLSCVLHILVMDADAENMNYNEWCDSYGYERDTFKAFESYRACLDGAEKLHEVFTVQELASIESLLADL